MPTIKLKTTLHREDIKGSRTYCVVRDAAKVFGSKGNIQVKGTLDGFAVEGTLMPRGDGSHWFAVKKEWRDAIGKSIGESVELILEDTVLSHSTPDDLQKAISKSKKAKAQWETFSDSKKKYYIVWIENAKQEDTRKKRIKEAIKRIEKGLNQND
jgi:hypothetical protein